MIAFIIAVVLTAVPCTFQHPHLCSFTDASGTHLKACAAAKACQPEKWQRHSSGSGVPE